MRSRWALSGLFVLVTLVALSAGACHKKVPPVARPIPPPPPAPTAVAPTKPPAPAEPVKEPVVIPPAPISEDKVSMASLSLDEINRNSPLKPVFFDYDRSDVSAEAQRVLDANAEVLKTYPAWVIQIEGHCDERGTAEYNLALGERRAAAARTYLVSLGISGDRIRTVSYGKEFPFDPAHDEQAWAKNRRDHFVVTQK
jgi:peptidoglycan-associated lipoprotein